MGRPPALAVSCDEMWTYLGARQGDQGEERWIWTAVVREIDGRRWVDFAVGDRSEASLLRLYESLPEAGRYRSDAYDVLSIIKIVLSLDPAFVRQVQHTLFEKVSFSNGRVPTPQQLAGAEEMAFDGLEPVAVYEALVRCLAVNFSESLRSVVSRFQGGTLDSSRFALSE